MCAMSVLIFLLIGRFRNCLDSRIQLLVYHMHENQGCAQRFFLQQTRIDMVIKTILSLFWKKKMTSKQVFLDQKHPKLVLFQKKSSIQGTVTLNYSMVEC